MNDKSYITEENLYSAGKLTFREPQPNYSLMYYIGDTLVGTLNFNVSPPTFEGDKDGSAKVFFDYAVKAFPHLLKERQDKELLEKLQALRVEPNCVCCGEEYKLDGAYLAYSDVVKLLQEQGI